MRIARRECSRRLREAARPKKIAKNLAISLEIRKTALSLHQHFCVYLFGFLGLYPPIRGIEFFYAFLKRKNLNRNC